MKHVCQPVDIRAVKLYNVKKKEVRKMKVLVVSDVHANIAALNTILEKEADYDILCCAGDYTDYGIYPAEVIERFRNLKNTHLVYGNHDLHVINTYESKEWKM